jgi:hypothetical protein
MSGIASIGTATNSNLAGAGPSINITCKTDLRTISQFSLNDNDLKNGEHDIRRHQLCVAVPQRQIQAYGAVFSFDPFVEMPVTLSPVVDFTKLPSDVIQSRLDMNISRYYRDVCDARNDLEYILATCQISLHSLTESINTSFAKMQDRLITQTAAGPTLYFHRRNALYIETDANVFTTVDISHGGIWTLVTGCDNLYQFAATNQPQPLHTNSMVFGIYVEMADAGEDLATRVYNVEAELDFAIRHIMRENPPKVHTVKNAKSAPIEPPDLVYAGIALTDACAHPQNGDTAVTLNIFSALTVDNGPFNVLINDDLMWIHEIELADFEVDGMRRQRIVLDMTSIANALFVQSTTASSITINRNFTRFQLIRNRTSVTTPFKHVPGNPSRKTFLIAPQKKGFGLLKRSSIKDKMRHIGTSISSCMPSKRLDLVNGAVAKF